MPRLFNIVLEVLARIISQERNNCIQIGKEEVKPSLFANDMMTLYIGNHKDTIKKLLDFINKFSNVAGYKINIQRSFAFLYRSNELSERQTVRKQSHLKLHQKE